MIETQMHLAFSVASRRGGRRAGSGRKRAPGRRPGVPHRPRPMQSRHDPLLVTLRAVPALQCLRAERVFPSLRCSLSRAGRDGFRVVHFSVQRDHVHLLVEADGPTVLECGMRGLTTRLALATNRALARRGRVWGDRYHARPLRTPREVRSAIVYVLANARKHLRQAIPLADPCSSAAWFDGYREDGRWVDVGSSRAGIAPIAPARTWLLRVGWRRYGPIALDEAPARALLRSHRHP